jgi:aryl-alcohol dehydrogenase-like predicted oxidoreductase
VRDPQTVTIPKASSIAHVEDNAQAGELQLSGTELRELEQAFSIPGYQSELPML